MGIMSKALRLLMPRGSLWHLTGDTGLLIDGIGDSIDRARAYIMGVVDESDPATASELLPEWHATLGVRYDATRSIAQQRLMLSAIISSVGGMTLNQLQAQIDKEFTGITVSELSASSLCGEAECGLTRCGGEHTLIDHDYYLVSGEVASVTDALRVGAILEHFAPLHLIPVNGITVAGLTGESRCGLALTGIAVCGY